MALNPDIKSIEVKSPGAALLEKLRAGTKNEKRFKYPGSDVEFVMVPLNCQETQASWAAAYQRFKELGIELSLLNQDDFWSEHNMQILSRAMRDANDTSKPFFGSAQEMRESITPDERTLLTSCYIELEDETNPDPSDMDPAVMAAIDELVKKKDIAQLKGFGSSKLVCYMITMGNLQSN